MRQTPHTFASISSCQRVQQVTVVTHIFVRKVFLIIGGAHTTPASMSFLPHCPRHPSERIGLTLHKILSIVIALLEQRKSLWLGLSSSQRPCWVVRSEERRTCMLWRCGARAHNHAGAPEVIVCRTESWTSGKGISMQQHTILIENYILMNHRRDLQTNTLSIILPSKIRELCLTYRRDMCLF